MTTLNLEIGKKYVRRDGAIRTIAKAVDQEWYPYAYEKGVRFVDTHCDMYRADGWGSYSSEPQACDLVSEFVLNLEVGKYYRDISGNIIMIDHAIGNEEDGFQFTTKDDVVYDSDGTASGFDGGENLIEEVIVLPAPVQSTDEKKVTIGRPFILVVHATTDGVPGTYDNTSDLINELAAHSYIRKIDLIEV